MSKHTSVLEVHESLNIAKVDAMANRLHREKFDFFQIPEALSDSGAIGIEASVLQLYATWLRALNSQTLRIPVEDVSNSLSYKKICNRLYGMCALRLTDNITNFEGQPVLKNIALKESAEIFEAIRSERYEDAISELYIPFLSVSARPINNSRSKEFLSPLYNGENVVGHKKFSEIVKRIVDSMLPEIATSNKDYEQFIGRLSDIVRELFTNTHEHARVDENGNVYEKNFRAITFQVADISRERLLDLSASNSPRSVGFFADWLPESGKLLKVLEINIVDSGPGLARRWNGTSKLDLTEENEINAVLKCFGKHSTTSDKVSSGSGLSNVIADIKYLRGWFRLRSGSLFAEKAFFKKRGAPRLEKSDIQYKGSFLEGTAYTLVFPVESLLERY